MDNDIFMNEDEYKPRKSTKEKILDPIYIMNSEYDGIELNETSKSAQNRNSTSLKNRNNKIGDSTPNYYKNSENLGYKWEEVTKL